MKLHIKKEKMEELFSQTDKSRDDKIDMKEDTKYIHRRVQSPGFTFDNLHKRVSDKPNRKPC